MDSSFSPVFANRFRRRVALKAFGAARSLLASAGALLLALGALQGCSPHAEEKTAAAPASPYVAVARGRVDVEGGLLNLAAPVAGIVASVKVREGEHVNKGALVVTLDARAATLALDAAKTVLEQTQARVKLDDVRLQAARAQGKRLSAAAAAGVADGQSADQAHAGSAALAAQRAVDEAAVAEARQGVARARFALEQHRVVAPTAGDVVRVAAQPGMAATPEGASLLTLLPDTPRIVRAELNESYADAVKPGMRAEVQTEDGRASWPARVTRVAPVYGPSTLLDDPARRANARSLEFVLALDAPTPPLRVGQRVMVRVLPESTAPKTGG